MPRRMTPPRCGAHTDENGVRHEGCGAPIAWAYLGESKKHAKWIAIDGADLSEAERLEKIPYDSDIHEQHRCREQGPQPARIDKTVGPIIPVLPVPLPVDPRVYLAGQALVALSGGRHPLDMENVESTATVAVEIADAILAELAKS